MRKAFLVLAVAVLGAALVVAPVSAAPAASKKRSIAATAASAPQFSTLVSLLKQARLAGTLDKKGPFTVFAPTNAAFKRLPKSTLKAVANDPALLKKVLLYHVVKGKVPAAKVVKLNGKSARTLAGQPVKVRIRNGKVFLDGKTQVVKTDLMASNGVIHVINRVLVPSS
jgi:uncharacterized surface protein with fasciclin (FAS1) repeats